MWVSWSLSHSGVVSGSSNQSEPTPTASMIKAWIVADYLRLHGFSPDLSTIIRDSANEPAWEIYRILGRDESIRRCINLCGLTDSAPGEDLSMTMMSARDALRLGTFIAGESDWLLNEMRQVRGVGDFGIRDAFPSPYRETIAIKNGWETRAATAEWNVTCLAIAGTWTMSVLMRYPSNLPLETGATVARNLASQLINP